MKTGRFEMRVPAALLKRWRAVASSEGRTLAGWLTHIANTEYRRVEHESEQQADDDIALRGSSLQRSAP